MSTASNSVEEQTEAQWGLLKRMVWFFSIGLLLSFLLNSQTALAESRYDLWRLYEIAKDYDAEHKQRLAELASRKVGLETNLSALLPRISISGEVAHTDDTFKSDIPGVPDISLDSTNRNIGINLEQTILDLGALGEYKRARAAMRGLTAEAKELDQQFILSIVDAYFEMLSAQVDLTVAQEQERSFEQQLENIQARNRAGVARTADVRDARARLDNAKIETIVAQSSVDVAAEEMLLRTGAFVDWLPDLKGDLEISLPQPATMEDWLALAEENSPRLVVGASNVRQANVRRKQALRAYAPRASFIGSYRAITGTQVESDLPDREGSDFRLRVEMPLYLGGRLRKDIERTTIDWASTRQANIFERRSLERDIAALYKLLATEVARVAAQERALASSISALKSSQLGYENGLRTILDVLAAQQSVSQSKRSYARARHDYVRRYVSLMVRAGTQDEEKLREINRWLISQ